MSDDMNPRRDYHTGQRLVITAEWQKRAKKAKAAEGLSLKAITDVVGGSVTQASVLFREDSIGSTSSLVGPVSRMLGVPLPAPPELDERARTLAEIASELNDSDVDTLITLARSLANKK